MTALLEVATHVPEQRMPIEAVAERFGLTEMQVKVFRRYHRLGEVACDPQGDLKDLLRGALSGLAGLAEAAPRVRYVLHARAFPVVAPYPHDPVREVCAEFGLGHAAFLAVGHHGCASGLLALDTAGRLLAADAADAAADAAGEGPGGGPIADGADPATAPLALVLAGEKTFTPEAQLLTDTSFYGEGASAALVARSGPVDRVLSYAVDQHPEFDRPGEEAMLAFQRDYAPLQAGVIAAAAERAGVAVGDLAAILPHNVNQAIWRQVAKILGVPSGTVLMENIPRYGHVFCADAFLNYATAADRGLLKPGARYAVAAGAARGTAFSAMVLQH